jgi:DNA-binding GntR family transcriptional regulator
LVYEQVRDYVLGPEVISGIKIDENLLARRLGVSRSPVREALARLSQDGIVETIPNRGTFKVKLGADDIMEIMGIRAALQGFSIRMGVRRVTDDVIEEMKALFRPFHNDRNPIDYHSYFEADKRFHDILDRLSGCKRLIKLIDVFDRLSGTLRKQALRDPRRIRASLRGHLQIIDALEKRNGVVAEKRLRKTIKAAADYLVQMVAADTPRGMESANDWAPRSRKGGLRG